MSDGAQTDWFAQNVPKGKPAQPSDDWFQQNAPKQKENPPSFWQRLRSAITPAPDKVVMDSGENPALGTVPSTTIPIREGLDEAGALSNIAALGMGGESNMGTPRPSVAEVAAGTRAVGRGLTRTFLRRPGIKAFLEGYRGGPPGPELGSLETTEMPSLEPSVLRIPEPRAALPTDRPGANFSVPREQLPALALRGVPGAGDVLRNTGTTILYTPPEGYPGPRSAAITGEQPRPRVVVIRPAADD